MPFPATRLRRLRQNDRLRNLVRETRLTPDAFVYPLFVCPGSGVRKAIGSMPGVFNLSVDEAVKEAREAKSLGISAIILFGLPEHKDEIASGAWASDGITQRAIRAIKGIGILLLFPLYIYASRAAVPIVATIAEPFLWLRVLGGRGVGNHLWRVFHRQACQPRDASRSRRRGSFCAECTAPRGAFGG